MALLRAIARSSGRCFASDCALGWPLVWLAAAGLTAANSGGTAALFNTNGRAVVEALAFARKLLVWWSAGVCTRAATVMTAGGGDVSVPRCEDDVEVAALPRSCGRHVLAAGAASRRWASSWSRAFCWRRLALLLSRAAWSAPRLVFCPLGAGLGFELLSLEPRILLRCVWR